MAERKGKGGTSRAKEIRPCPICGKPAEPDFYPFCSRRCTDIDLNRWLSGGYAIPVKPEEEEDASQDEAESVPRSPVKPGSDEGGGRLN